MPTIQISKIQLRRGPQSDLPGIPTSLGPPAVFSDSLDDGEIGFASDTGRLFIGHNSDGMPNSQRTVFPYQNIEIYTENTPNIGVIHPSPMVPATSFSTLMLDSATNRPLYIDMPSSGVNAIINYFIFDTHGAIRSGTMDVVWNPTQLNPPLCVDEATTDVDHINDVQWTAAHVSSHTVLQYINLTGANLSVWLNITSPLII